MSKATLMGKMLNRIRFERSELKRKAERDLYLRNKIDNPTMRDGYKIEERKIVTKDGKENYTFELWHKVDEERVSLSTTTVSEIIKEESDDINW